MTLSRRIKIFSDGSYEQWPILWRVKHDTALWRSNLPEVNPFLPSHFTEFTRPFQLLERQLNYKMIDSKWRNLHLGGNLGDKATAFNNRNGFEMVGDPRVDYINLKHIGSPVPKQAALVCGGGILAQKFIQDGYLYCDYIDGNQPAPTLQYVLDHPWLYFDAVSVDGGANGSIVIRRFPQGNGERVYILLLAKQPIKIHLSRVTKLAYGSELPSPYRVP